MPATIASPAVAGRSAGEHRDETAAAVAADTSCEEDQAELLWDGRDRQIDDFCLAGEGQGSAGAVRSGGVGGAWPRAEHSGIARHGALAADWKGLRRGEGAKGAASSGDGRQGDTFGSR